jgi:broad specificity phosphatase PhoE
MTKPQATTLLLIRHAHTDALGISLSGRSAGVPLSGVGRAQADQLARELAHCYPLAAIYTSPLERAMQTAEALRRYQHVPVRRSAALLEIDFGEWTGRTFAALEQDAAWQRFNATRSAASIPGGEGLASVQERIVLLVARLSARHPGQCIALVTHADVLRFALLHYVRATLDDYARFELAPASVTALSVAEGWTEVLFVNRVSGEISPGSAPLDVV